MDNRPVIPVSLLLLVVAFGTLSTLPSAHASSTVEISTSNGSTICPTFLSGNGNASWNPTTNTCTLSSTAQVSPTLCIGTNVGGCVLFAIDLLQIDSGVTFSIDTTIGGLAVYSSLSNYGSIDAINSAGITNYGTIDNSGTINSTSFIDNLPYNKLGIINNHNGAVISNYGNINNLGTVNNTGIIDNICPGTIDGNAILGNPVQNHNCPPSAPVITTPFGSTFQTPTPTITGTSQASVTIVLFDNATRIGTTTSDMTGNWSITTSTLIPGPHNLTATATSALGTSLPSEPVIILIVLTSDWATVGQDLNFNAMDAVLTGSLSTTATSVSAAIMVTVTNATNGTAVSSEPFSISFTFNSTGNPNPRFVLVIQSKPYVLGVTCSVTVSNSQTNCFLSRDPNVSQNGRIGIQDVSMVELAYGSSVGSSRYNPMADLAAYGTVNIVDFAIVVADYNAPLFT